MQHNWREVYGSALAVQQSYVHCNHRVDAVDFLCVDHGDRQVLAFKGTSPNRGRWGLLSLLWDILSDVRFFPRTDRDYGLGTHPAGFLECAEDLVEYIFCEDNDIDCYKPTHLCGHSLGGAALLIAAPVMIAHGMDIKSIITFGAPNVGKLPRLPGVKVSCFRNGKDFITSLPPFYGDSYDTIQLRGNAGGAIKDHRINSYVDTIHRFKTDQPCQTNP